MTEFKAQKSSPLSSGQWNSGYAFAELQQNGSVSPLQSSDDYHLLSALAQMNGTIKVTSLYSAGFSMSYAALRQDGSVITWGSDETGGDSRDVASQINGRNDVKILSSTSYSFAALRQDGSVVTWGNGEAGGDSSSVASQINGDNDVSALYSTRTAFAALRKDGSVVTWGLQGGNSQSVAGQINGDIDVITLRSTDASFAALRRDGSVITWGSDTHGGDSSSVANQVNGLIEVTQLYSNPFSFAALRKDGSVVTWGNQDFGGNSARVASALNGSIDVVTLSATLDAFAALRQDGSVVTWGDSGSGGNSHAVASALDGQIDVTGLCSSNVAFAALRQDGSVITWGDEYGGGNSNLVAKQIDGTIDVLSLCATDYAFAALRKDGSVVTWGLDGYGGDSSEVASQMNGSVKVLELYSDGRSFAALREDGHVVTWGSIINPSTNEGGKAAMSLAETRVSIRADHGAFPLALDVGVSTTDDSTLLLSGDNAIPGQVEIWSNGQSLGRALVGADGTWSYTTPELSIGQHTLSARYIDLNGVLAKEKNLGEFNIQQGQVGSAQRDILQGATQGDILMGNSGDDLLIAGGGSNIFDGGQGFDSVQYKASSHEYSIRAYAGGVQDQVGNSDINREYIATFKTADGKQSNDLLLGVERVLFNDNTGIALDIDGHAGSVGRLMYASFGYKNASAEIAGIGLALMDGGMNEQQISELILTTNLFQELSHGASNQGMVNQVFEALVGRAPSDVEAAYYVDQLDRGEVTQAELLLSASYSPANKVWIGLQEFGLAYELFA